MRWIIDAQDKLEQIDPSDILPSNPVVYEAGPGFSITVEDIPARYDLCDESSPRERYLDSGLTKNDDPFAPRVDEKSSRRNYINEVLDYRLLGVCESLVRVDPKHI